MNVTFYSNIKDVDSRQEYGIESLLDMIRNGAYQDIVLKVRREKDKDIRKALKAKVPNFTVSGTFTRREDQALVQHSGLIAIDFDDISDIDRTFEMLCNDRYTFALFRSISGYGLCCLVKINADKHVESFEGLKDYYWRMMELTIDPACRNVSRTRYISYDPDLYHNEDADVFKETKRIKEIDRSTHFIHTDAKFQRIVNAIDRDITGSYHQWSQIGFGIAATYGAEGWAAFDRISSFGPTYKPEACRKQYDNCVKHANGSVSINTFYYYAKQAGIDISNQREDYVARTAYYLKQNNKNLKDIATQIGNITIADKQIIKAVLQDDKFEPPAKSKRELNIHDVLNWMRSKYDIKRNELTRSYELEDRELETEKLNEIFIDAKQVFPKLGRDMFEFMIFSTYTPSYNPVKDYLDSLTWDGQDRMEQLAATINSDTGTLEWRQSMLTKWMLGIINTVYTGEPNILCLVLAGLRNTGKTQFFKRLLPEPLKRYFANSQLDKGKDDDLLMTQKLIIFDDEYSGKSKQDAKHMKMMLSSDSFTLREPYGRKNVTLPRLASLCGTCNETEILNDSTGNRRIIVFEAVGQFDYDGFNTCDKTQVFAQLVHLHRSGVSSELTGDEIALLDEYTAVRYSEVVPEAEMITTWFEPPGDRMEEFLTATEIKDYIEMNSKQRLSIRKIGMELRRLGYQRLYSKPNFGFKIAKKTGQKSIILSVNDLGEDAPF